VRPLIFRGDFTGGTNTTFTFRTARARRHKYGELLYRPFCTAFWAIHSFVSSPHSLEQLKFFSAFSTLVFINRHSIPPGNTYPFYIFSVSPFFAGTNKRGKTISLKQQGIQTAKNKNTKTAAIVIRFIVCPIAMMI
jgi:hypothetical protein